MNVGVILVQIWCNTLCDDINGITALTSVGAVFLGGVKLVGEGLDPPVLLGLNRLFSGVASYSPTAYDLLSL